MVRTAQGWNSGTSESKLYKQSLEDHLSEGWWDEGGGGAGIQTLNGQRGKPLIPFPNLSFWTPPIRSLSGPFLPSPGSTPLFPSELSFWLISISLPTLPVSWNHPIPPKDGFQNSMHVSFSKKTYLSTSPFMQCRAVRKKQFFSWRPLHLIKPACHQDTGLLFVFQFVPAPIAQLPPIQFVPKLPYLPLTGLDTWGNMLHLLPLVFVNLLTSLATPTPCLVAPKKEKENPDSQPDIHGTRVPASAVSLACLILIQLHWTPQLPQAVIPSPPSLQPSPNILPCVLGSLSWFSQQCQHVAPAFAPPHLSFLQE